MRSITQSRARLLLHPHNNVPAQLTRAQGFPALRYAATTLHL
ncbi:hypothetical protein PXO_03926 [Xanthomonas oryzae pv. oryzae PXO99A]|uniref:Uncharacterized protein n=1 Tax=Xanthomonas oryzae pv. oryzae (strain PXO99A) TaxID=360094 RepID=A0A0K0GGN7_XANOP|nr:hypothetical protein PXO_03926 [Xanthomonas oryzae pv. oryzae PXO99A]